MSAYTEGKLRVEPGTSLIWSERDPEDATSRGFGYPIAQCLTAPCSSWAKGPSADEGEANASHLALCWNMHGPLVEAVEAVLQFVSGADHILEPDVKAAVALLTRIKEQKS